MMMMMVMAINLFLMKQKKEKIFNQPNNESWTNNNSLRFYNCNWRISHSIDFRHHHRLFIKHSILQTNNSIWFAIDSNERMNENSFRITIEYFRENKFHCCWNLNFSRKIKHWMNEWETFYSCKKFLSLSTISPSLNNIDHWKFHLFTSEKTF